MLPRAVSSILLTICLVLSALDQHCVASVLKRRACSIHPHPHDDGVMHTHTPSAIPSHIPMTITEPPTGIQTAPPKHLGQPTIDCTRQGPIQAEGLTEALCLCPSGTSTVSLPVLTVPPHGGFGPEASCAYTALPKSAEDLNPITSIWTSTWTNALDCNACTLTGGQDNAADCTSMPSCTPVPTVKVTWSNNTIPIGDFVDTDTDYTPSKKRDDSVPRNVTAVTERLFEGMIAAGGPCESTSGHCDSTRTLVFDDVATTSGQGVDYYKITFTVDSSSYDKNTYPDDESVRNEMLAAGLTMWSLVATQNCQDIEYKADASDTGSGCGNGPIQRKRSPLDEMDKRSPISPGDVSIDRSMECTYSAKICQAPDGFHVVSGPHDDPYRNSLDVQIKSELEGQDDALTCKEILGVTEAAIVALSWWNPGLAAQAQLQESKFIAMCEIGEQIRDHLEGGSTDASDYLPLLESLSNWA